MNNHQLIRAFPPLPTHSIHRVPTSDLFNRWLTSTAQPFSIGGRRWSQIRQDALDALYKDWEDFRTAGIVPPY